MEHHAAEKESTKGMIIRMTRLGPREKDGELQKYRPLCVSLQAGVDEYVNGLLSPHFRTSLWIFFFFKKSVMTYRLVRPINAYETKRFYQSNQSIKCFKSSYVINYVIKDTMDVFPQFKTDFYVEIYFCLWLKTTLSQHNMLNIAYKRERKQNFVGGCF